MNPIMALFRPGPNEDNRIIFNWAHRLVGTSTFILAIFNIFLGLYLPGVDEALPSWVVYIMIGYAGFHLITEIILFTAVSKEKTKPEQDLPMSSAAALTNTDVDDFQCSNQAVLMEKFTKFNLKRWILLTYMIVTLSFVVTLVVVIMWPPKHC